MAKSIGHWINGDDVGGAGDTYGSVYDPATGSAMAQVRFATQMEVDKAVEVANSAFLGWRDTSLSQRSKILFAFRGILEAKRRELAVIITNEHGKTLEDAAGEIQRGIEVVEFACGIPSLLKGGHSENLSTGLDAFTVLQPLGVMVGITPFNFPVMVPMWMFPVAIACGNTFILKPSEKDPSASLVLARAFSEAGLPDGVFNVLQGDKLAVDGLLTHPSVSGVSFVGSTPVARHVYEQSMQTVKRVQALGGAKNHAVVLPDADLANTAEAIVSAAFGSAGERCMALSVVVAVGSVADPLVTELEKRIGNIKTGSGHDPSSDMGPLVTEGHRNKVLRYIEVGEKEGASLIVDGRGVVVKGYEQGFFLGPCLFDRVNSSMTIYQEEIFGPVLSVIRVDTFDDALSVVNTNKYGNGAVLFTSSGHSARRFQHEVEVGMVGINVPIPTPMAYYSFGGWKQSLFGDSYLHGLQGIHFSTRTKTMTVRWPSAGARDVAQFEFPTAD